MHISLRKNGALKAETQGRGAAWAACLCQGGLWLDSGVVKVAVPSRWGSLASRSAAPPLPDDGRRLHTRRQWQPFLRRVRAKAGALTWDYANESYPAALT